jgi:hypothetical protein
MSRRKLGEKQTLKRGLTLNSEFSHTPVHDARTTRTTAAANANAAAAALSSVARTSLR